LGNRPFSESERTGIESVATEIFAGRYRPDNEICVEYHKWIPAIINLYLPIVDSESGDFRHLPFSGSLADQPHVTMELLRIVQLAYRSEVSRRIKEGH
jgi:hypothetical protein